MIAHTDWSARNVRLGSDRVLAVYDWDSLALVPESTAVGQAAATWSSTAEPGEQAPSLTEIVDYVRGYEDARGHTFSAGEHRAIGAAVVWVLAYAARCEHAIDPHSEVHRRARPRLAADGAALLCRRRSASPPVARALLVPVCRLLRIRNKRHTRDRRGGRGAAAWLRPGVPETGVKRGDQWGQWVDGG